MVAILPKKLEALKKRALALVSDVDSIIQVKSLPDGSINFYDEVKHFEVVLIRWALNREKGNQAKAARLLGLKPTTLNRMIHRHGIIAGEDASKKRR